MRNLSKVWRTFSFLAATFSCGIFILISIDKSHAAPLNYSADTTVSLTSPAVNLTIKSGSVADVLTVNATSAIVTMSNTTGGNFTLTSASRDLTITASAGGGSISTSCSGAGNTFGTASSTISQTSGSASYTIAPAGSPCIAPQGAIVGVGSMGAPYISGVGLVSTSTAFLSQPIAAPGIVTSATSTPTASVSIAPTSITNIPNTPSFFQELLALLIKVRTLSVEMLNSVVPHRDLTRDLRGDDVWALQTFLISNNLIEPTGSRARELDVPTSYFGCITKGTLLEYQGNKGVSPAAGYFGPKTREYLLAHYREATSSMDFSEPLSVSSLAPSDAFNPFMHPIRWGMYNRDVACLQTFFSKNSAIYPEGTVSGHFDEATLSAVQRFQLKYDLAHDGDKFYGFVGPQTRAKLNALLAAGDKP